MSETTFCQPLPAASFVQAVKLHHTRMIEDLTPQLLIYPCGSLEYAS